MVYLEAFVEDFFYSNLSLLLVVEVVVTIVAAAAAWVYTRSLLYMYFVLITNTRANLSCVLIYMHMLTRPLVKQNEPEPKYVS